MASLRQIRGRIKSIQSSKQIMRAMQLVSASKLKRTQDKLIQGRSVMEFLDGLLARVLAATSSTDEAREASERKTQDALAHPLMVPKPAGDDLLVVFTSDTGLCGAYNTNLISMTEACLRRDAQQPVKLVFIGKRAYRYFAKRGFQASEAYLDLAGRPNPARTDAIGRALMGKFLSGQARSIQVLYSRFLSATNFKPTIQRWLPIQWEGLTATAKATPVPTTSRFKPMPVEYIFEPSPEAVFGDLLPRWAMAKFQLMMLEAFTSEHSARMVAMKNATDNAEELLQELTMLRNRTRQAAITKELSEIVGTAEALK